VCVHECPHFEDLLEAVFRRRGKTQHAEVADESGSHVIAPASRRSARGGDGHFLERKAKREDMSLCYRREAELGFCRLKMSGNIRKKNVFL